MDRKGSVWRFPVGAIIEQVLGDEGVQESILAQPVVDGKYNGSGQAQEQGQDKHPDENSTLVGLIV